MLVLSRELGQKIVVDGPCEITVVEFRRGYRVRLGFTAPTSTTILRGELVRDPVPVVGTPDTDPEE